MPQGNFNASPDMLYREKADASVTLDAANAAGTVSATANAGTLSITTNGTLLDRGDFPNNGLVFNNPLIGPNSHVVVATSSNHRVIWYTPSNVGNGTCTLYGRNESGGHMSTSTVIKVSYVVYN